MDARAAARLAWATFALDALLLGGSLLFEMATAADKYLPDLSSIVILPFVVVGIVIGSRQPRNGIGWILLAVGLVWGLSDAAFAYAAYSWFRERALPGAGVAMALGSASWVPGIGLIGTYLLLLFPDGKLPSPSWRRWAWFCGVALLLPAIVITFFPGPLDQQPFEDVQNPLGIETLRPLENVLLPSIFLVPLAVLGCAVALIQRFRRSRGVERLQLKWLATAAGVCAAIYLLAMLVSISEGWSTEETPFWIGVIQNVAFLSFLLIPVAIGAAILRYRLYDIDIIINRTLVYGALTGFLALTYLALVYAFQQLFRPVVGESGIAVAASTLAVAALFRPARSRIQHFIDRRFYRRKYDAARTVELFSSRLRDEVDLDAMQAQLVGVVQETMQPRWVSIWLRG